MTARAPKAKKIIKKYLVDIVFCIDVTASMKPCIDGIKENITYFIKQLEDGNLDFQLALIGYRDLHDTAISDIMKVGDLHDTAISDVMKVGDLHDMDMSDHSDNIRRVCDEPWFNSEGFTNSVDKFITWLNNNKLSAFGGGDEPESTLDALYLALNMPGWRASRTHRVIILFTDSDTHPTLSPKTYQRKDNTVGRVIQELSTRMKHGILYMCAPRSDIYDRIQRQGNDAGRKVIMELVEPGQGLQEMNFAELLEMIGKTVSSSAPSVFRGRED